MRTLAAHRQTAAVAKPAIAADIHQPLDIHLHAFAQVAFDIALFIDDVADTVQFVFAQVANFRIDADLRFTQDRRSPRPADTVNIGKADLRSFMRRYIYSCYTSHNSPKFP